MRTVEPIVAPRVAPGSHPVEGSLLAGLIRGELVEWTRMLAETQAGFEADMGSGLIQLSGNASRRFIRAKELIGKLTEKMELIGLLAETYSDPQADNRERLLLEPLLLEILGKSAGSGGAFEVLPTGSDVGPVYGNRHWMTTLLVHLLREMQVALPAGHRVSISVRQLGNHQLVVARTRSENNPRAARRTEAVLPQNGASLSFSLCRRIAELHGGTLRLETEDDDDGLQLVGYALSLPTGDSAAARSAACETCPLQEQMESYAADLAQLIERCDALEHPAPPAHRPAPQRATPTPQRG